MVDFHTGPPYAALVFHLRVRRRRGGVCILLGDPVGAIVGAGVDILLGDPVGVSVAAGVGISLGDPVGAIVGAGVGILLCPKGALTTNKGSGTTNKVRSSSPARGLLGVPSRAERLGHRPSGARTTDKSQPTMDKTTLRA